MKNYIDGFVFPIARKHLEEYKQVAEQVAEIWKEYGAIAYYEYVGDGMALAGTRSFLEFIDASGDEVVVMGWVVFSSKEVRDDANKKVPEDSRIETLIAPLIDPKRMIFHAERMVYGGFQAFIQLE